MRVVLALIVVLVAVGSVACGSPLSSAEETQTAAAGAGPEASATLATAAPVAESTTNPDEMEVYGYAWIDAERANAAVRAYVGGVECASANAASPADGYESWYAVHIPSASVKPGCGVAGGIVSFTVGGRDAKETVAWSPGQVGPIDLIAGPDFERIYGSYALSSGGTGEGELEAVIDGQSCGLDTSAFGLTGGEQVFSFIIFPAELRPGCGEPGAQITLEFATGRGAARTVTARSMSTYPWEPGAVRREAVVLEAVTAADTEPSTTATTR